MLRSVIKSIYIFCEWMMSMKNKVVTHLTNNVTYFYIDKPIIIIKTFWQIHMAKVRYIETQEEDIVDISIIRKVPSKDKSISISWLRRSSK